MYVARIQLGHHNDPSFVMPAGLLKSYQDNDREDLENFEGRIQSGMDEIYKEIKIDPERAFSNKFDDTLDDDEEAIRNGTLNSNEYLLESSFHKIKRNITTTI